MRQQNDGQELMRIYLLGSLDGAQLEEVEVRLLSDAQFRDDLQTAQEELIDDYAFGVLSERDHQRFEQHFLVTPERADKLRFARAMRGYLGQSGVREAKDAEGSQAWWRRLLRPPARRKLLVAVSLAICLLAVAFFLVLRESYQRRSLQEQMARAAMMRAEIEREVERWTKRPPAGYNQRTPLAELTLTPGLLREMAGAGTPRRIVLTNAEQIAQLRLELPERRFESYDATLLTNEDVVVFDIGSLSPESGADDRVLFLRIPAKSLPTGDYELRLRGTTAEGLTADAGRYPFQVVNRSASH